MKFKNQLPVTILNNENLKTVTGYDHDELDVVVEAEAWRFPQTYWEPEDAGCEVNHVFIISADGAIIDIAEHLTEIEIESLAEQFFEVACEEVYKPMMDMEE